MDGERLGWRREQQTGREPGTPDSALDVPGGRAVSTHAHALRIGARLSSTRLGALSSDKHAALFQPSRMRRRQPARCMQASSFQPNQSPPRRRGAQGPRSGLAASYFCWRPPAARDWPRAAVPGDDAAQAPPNGEPPSCSWRVGGLTLHAEINDESQSRTELSTSTR